MKYLSFLKHSITALAVASTLISCDDFLDRAPMDQISQVTYWKTPDHLNAFIVGKYSWLPGTLSDWGMGYYVTDVQSDDMVNRLTRDTYMNGENNTTPTSGNGWDFAGIRDMNIFFDNCWQCTSPFSVWSKYYGEACFLKAMRYHGLAWAFGDVPWYTHELTTTDEGLYKPRDKRSLVIDSVMNLMDMAVEYLPLRKDVGVNRLNKETALIYQSRIALLEGTWAKYHKGTPSASDVDSEKMFRKVIEAYETFKEECGPFADYIYTTGHPEYDYYNLFNQFDYSGIKEVTLSKDYNADLGIKNNVNVQSWLYGYFGGAYTLSLVQSYLDRNGQSIDVTDEQVVPGKGSEYLTELANHLDLRYRNSTFTPGDLITSTEGAYKDSLFTIPKIFTTHLASLNTTGFHPKKGHNPTAPIINQTDPLVDGISFRVAELMLNYAEAYVELYGTYPDLTDNIDLLRKRAGMPTLTEVKPQVTDYWADYGYPISDVLAIIRNERHIELAGEGYRVNDWKRWRAHNLFNGKRPKGYRYCEEDFTSRNLDIPTIPVDENGYLDPLKVNLNGGVYTFNPDRDYLRAIPMDELSKNPNLTQNPGWDSPKE